MIGPLLDAIDACTEEAHALLSSPSAASTPLPETLQTLGSLIQLNHSILTTLSVSHPKLERVRELIDTHNVGWTKLTGAGGGGCAIVLLKPEATKEMRREAEKGLEREGFGIYETVLGGKGVGVLEGSKGLERTGFRDASGSEEVEALVGVSGGGGGMEEGWRFWD